jgi:hypothetical protein
MLDSVDRGVEQQRRRERDACDRLAKPAWPPPMTITSRSSPVAPFADVG